VRLYGFPGVGWILIDRNGDAEEFPGDSFLPPGVGVWLGGLRLDLPALLRRGWYPGEFDSARGVVKYWPIVDGFPVIGEPGSECEAHGTVWIRRTPAWPEHLA